MAAGERIRFHGVRSTDTDDTIDEFSAKRQVQANAISISSWDPQQLFAPSAEHKSMRQIALPPGTKLYRIVDPKSGDNAICWMSEAEFLKLQSKDDWRERFAVWANWNSNGEFVTYVVPPGKPLHVWEGVTASQKIGTDVVLVGGARQIVLDPAHMVKSAVGPRQKTTWGYDDLGVSNNLVGVPVLTNNWFVK